MFVGVLLAAGESRRYGENKLLAPLGDGTPMVVASARNLVHAGIEVVAVVREVHSAVGAALAEVPGVRPIGCPQAPLGIARSLASGIAQVPEADGWLVALGDMPLIRSETVRLVVRALEQGASLAAPTFGGRRGHPVGFSRCWREHLLGLEGDLGGRTLLDAHPDALALLPCADPGVLRDLDRPEDLERG